MYFLAPKTLNNSRKIKLYWYSTANYLGLILSIIAGFFLFPKSLSILGEIKYIETIGYFVFPFFLFGLAQGLVKFTPYFEKFHVPKLHGISLLISVGIFSFFFIGLFIINKVKPFNNVTYYEFGLILGLILALIDLTKSVSIIYNKVSFVIILEKVIPRLFLPILFYLNYIKVIPNNELLLLYVICYAVLTFIMHFYVTKETTTNFSLKYYFLFEKVSVKDFFEYCFFSFLGSFALLLINKIDNIIVPSYLSMSENGLYSILTTLASIIFMHATGINAIYGVAISKLLLKKKIYLLSRLYKSSTYHASFYSLIFIGIILISLPYIKHTLDPQNQFLNIETIVWILCLGAFSNVATGFNSEIIAYSKYFKFNLLIVGILLILNLIMVIYFLKFTALGLLGVAISSTTSIVLYNIFKTYYVYVKYNILPFSKSYLQMIGLNAILFIGILNISYEEQTQLTTFAVLFIYLALNIIFYRIFRRNRLKRKEIK
ncbi:MATE family efflux transporter [Flavobacterium oreochromis]|uniref:Polysaccharide biosynthesis protein n=2 Tax=Flavobacterium TaxID=237 RepID=A0A246G8D8_9FLAO|nr:hypothetical protein [Flavobacterium oreochromis]OWP74970.1 hypothetical protein BWG23_12465 [Flavobacterium oreochromis]OWP75136.1 hypothetical protein BWK62_12730 [Flavobacterium oreochromis]POR21293.1 hypothetical protein BWK58_12625 [Flavobacterium columnare]